MNVKYRRIAAAGATVALSLGCAPAALAAPAPAVVVHVPCSAAALAADLASAANGETLSLAASCKYVLTAALPDISQNLTIDGNQATLERSAASGT
jgi:hypothetical protein